MFFLECGLIMIMHFVSWWLFEIFPSGGALAYRVLHIKTAGNWDFAILHVHRFVDIKRKTPALKQPQVYD